MAVIDRFPWIKHVALLMARSNGMINRYKTEREWLGTTDEVLAADGVYDADLRVLDEWLGTLTEMERETMADGEHGDVVALEQRAPNPEHCAIFNDIFEAC